MVKDVERYLAASDAFLFPSYSEAFALVEVEAAACGLRSSSRRITAVK